MRDGPRIGVLLGTHRGAGESDADVLARTVAAALRAEAAGYDEIWVTEHHFVDEVVSPSALTLAAYLLGATSRITVGTAVTLLGLHPPVHVAEQALLLDQLSGGRFMLGVGRTRSGPELDAFGRTGAVGPDTLPVALDELLTALGGVAPGGHRVIPRARTSGGPPVLVAASSPSSVDAAAARGVPLLLYFDKSPEAKAEMGARHGGSGHAFAVFAAITGSPAEAREVAERRARADAGAILARPENVGPGLPTLDELTARIAEGLLNWHPIGDPETCVRRLVQDMETSGCRRVLLRFEHSALVADRALDRFAADVVPGVRAALGARSMCATSSDRPDVLRRHALR